MKTTAIAPVSPLRQAGGIVAVERSLAILNAFLGGEDSRGLSELARATGLAKPTVLRNLVSLERMGYVARLADGRYQLGARLLVLGDAYRARFRLEDHVLPVLRKLAAATGESASFQVMQDGQRLMLYRIEGPQTVRDVQDLSGFLPLDGASISQALTRADWAADLARGRPCVFFTAGLTNRQTASMACAVHGVAGVLRGALNISGPVERMATANLAALAGEVAAAAGRLSASLGASMPARPAAPELIRP